MTDLKIFKEAQLEGLENRVYYENLEKRILGFFEHQKMQLYRIYLSYYEERAKEMVYNRPGKSIILGEPEPAGMRLEFNCPGRFDKVPDWIYELIDRLRWNQFPKEYFDKDYDTDSREWDEEFEIENCWHHTGISWNTGFSNVPFTIWKLEIGFCYCS